METPEEFIERGYREFFARFEFQEKVDKYIENLSGDELLEYKSVRHLIDCYLDSEIDYDYMCERFEDEIEQHINDITEELKISVEALKKENKALKCKNTKLQNKMNQTGGR